MRHEHERSRRHAENTIAEANRHLDSGKITNPRHHQMLTAMIKDATDTLRNLDDMDDRRPYSDTRIGYNARTNDMLTDAMDAINRILPKMSNDDRYDDDYDDYDDVVDQPRWRSRRTGRFLPNLYGPRRVRRVRRRAEMDDRYADDRYDDRYDDARRTTDEARRMADETRRMAREARQAADDARRTADDILPTMRTNDTRNDRRYTSDDTRNDRKYTSDDERMHGPDTRR